MIDPVSADIRKLLVSLNDFGAQWDEVGSEASAAFERVGRSGRYILGPEGETLERKLASLWGLSEAIVVGNGMDAIEIALRASGLSPGAKVLTTPLSAFATTLAILRCGGIPVFTDVDDSGLINLSECRRVLEADPSIRYFVPVHLYGHAMDLAAVESLRDDFDLTVIEDCAQAIGARSRGLMVGVVGRAAAVSFYPTKNLGALGDGGAVLTSNHGLAVRARAMRHYGQSATYVHEEFGLNSRMDEVHAAILADAFLPRLIRWTSRRKCIAARYQEAIQSSVLQIPAVPDGSDSVWHLFPVLVLQPERRDHFREYLAARGVASGIHYPRLIPEQKALVDHGRYEIKVSLSRATRFASCEVSLPIHPYLSEDDVDNVIESVNGWGG